MYFIYIYTTNKIIYITSDNVGTINKILELLNKLINVRYGIKFSKGKILSTEFFNSIPTNDQCKTLFEKYPVFIEPYCEFLTCLYFNFNSYIKFTEENIKKNFVNYIKSIYLIIKEIINLKDINFFCEKIFLRELDESNISIISDKNVKKTYSSILYKILFTKNNSQNTKIKDLCIFYNSFANNTLLSYNNSSCPIYFKQCLILIYNYLEKISNNLDINGSEILNGSQILLLSLSTIDSYQNIRFYYNKNENQRTCVKKILLKYCEIIKKKYFDNLFRFQFSYLPRLNMRSKNEHFVKSNELINKINESEDKPFIDQMNIYYKDIVDTFFNFEKLNINFSKLELKNSNGNLCK